MGKNDNEFLRSIMLQRMTYHYGQRYDPNGEKAIAFAAKEQALMETLQPLTEEQRQAFRAYLDDLFDRSAQLDEMYYRSGLADGYKLCLLAQKMRDTV